MKSLLPQQRMKCCCRNGEELEVYGNYHHHEDAKDPVPFYSAGQFAYAMCLFDACFFMSPTQNGM